MTDVVIEHRVTNLEEAMADLARIVARTEVTVERTSASVDRLSLEMREFKDEMREFKDEMREFKDEMREFKEESRLSRDKSEANLQAYRAEQQAMRREFNQKQGEIANKLGTLAEDLVAPSLPRILQEVVACPDKDAVSMAVRVLRYHPANRGKSQQYDVIVSCGEYALFNETKATLKPGDIDRLIEKLAEVRAYFPEYKGVKIIGSLASLYVDLSLVTYANRQGLLVLATGDELMDVLNGSELKLREF